MRSPYPRAEWHNPLPCQAEAVPDGPRTGWALLAARALLAHVQLSMDHPDLFLQGCFPASPPKMVSFVICVIRLYHYVNLCSILYTDSM